MICHEFVKVPFWFTTMYDAIVQNLKALLVVDSATYDGFMTMALASLTDIVTRVLYVSNALESLHHISVK